MRGGHADPPEPKPPLDKEAARELYESGLEFHEVARRLGYHVKTVRRVLLASGVRKRGPVCVRTRKWHEPLYSTWAGMRRRCLNPKDRLYPQYGGTGVGICRAWESFEAFYRWALSSGYRPGLNLNLILKNRSRNFSPSNCTWATPSQRVLRWMKEKGPPRGHTLTAFGETKSISEWARDPRCTVSRSTLSVRIERGWRIAEAISLPSRPRQRSESRRRKSPARRKPIDWERAVALHTAKHRTPREIAEILGEDYYTILAGLKRIGVYEKSEKRVSQTPVGKSLAHRWRTMHRRCEDETHPSYARYGARGLRVARAWSEFGAFYEWAMSHGFKKGMWLERIDRKKGFSPSNCRWSDPAEIVRRDKDQVKPPVPRWTVTAFGETKGPMAWARDRRCQVSKTTLLRRLRGGWTPESAIREPPLFEREPTAVRLVTAFGVTKGLTEWTRDRRCKVTPTGLGARLDRGMAPEDAILAPPYRLTHVGRTSKARRKTRPR